MHFLAGWNQGKNGDRLFYLAIVCIFSLQIVSAVTIKGYYYPDEFASFLEKPFQWLYPSFNHSIDVNLAADYRSLYLQYWHYLCLKIFSFFFSYSASSALAFLKISSSCIWLIGLYFWYQIGKLILPTPFARLAILAFGFWYYTPFFGNRLLSENYAVAALAPAFYYLLWSIVNPEKKDFHRSLAVAAAGILIAMACQLRLQAGFFCIGPALYFAATRQYKPFFIFCSSFWMGFALFGFAEFFIRDAAFATVRSYYQINVTMGAISVNARPWYSYLIALNTQFGEWFFPAFLLLAIVGTWHQPLLGVSAAFFILAHMIFPHKEVRFIYPTHPMLFILFGVGFYQLWQKLIHVNRSYATAFAITLVMLYLSADIFQIRQTEWDGGKKGAMFRLIEFAGKQPDISALLRLDGNVSYGYFTFNRDVPFATALDLTAPPPPPSAYLVVFDDSKDKLNSWLAKYKKTAAVAKTLAGVTLYKVL